MFYTCLDSRGVRRIFHMGLLGEGEYLFLTLIIFHNNLLSICIFDVKKCFKKVQTVLQSDSSLRNFSQRVIIVCTVPVYFCLVLWSLSRTFCWTRFKSSSSGLLLCDQGVLWWQSCDNSNNFSQILTIFKQIEIKKGTSFKKTKLFTLFF